VQTAHLDTKAFNLH